MPVKIDSLEISENDIKDATKVLHKVINKEVNDAVKTGMTKGIEKGALSLGNTISKTLETAIIRAIRGTNIANEFRSIIQKARIGDALKDEISRGMSQLQKELPNVMKSAIPMPTATKTTTAGGKPLIPDIEIEPPEELTEQFDKLKDSVKELEEEFQNYKDIVEKAAKEGIDKEKVLRKAELKRAAELEKEIMSKKADMLRMTAGKGIAPTPAQPTGVEAMAGMVGKALGGPLVKALHVGMGFIMGELTDVTVRKLQSTMMNFNEKMREGLMSAGEMFNKQTLLNQPTSAAAFVKSLGKGIEESKVLKFFGGERVQANLAEITRVTKGTFDLKKETVIGATKAMENLAAKGLLAGKNLDEMTKAVVENIRVFGLSQTASEDFVVGLAEEEKKRGLATGVLSSYIKNANSSLKLWGHTLSESVYIAERWAHKLEQGSMSMGDIIEFASALHKRDEGPAMLTVQLMKQMSGMGSDIAKRIEEKAGGDVLAMLNIVQRLSEGTQGIAKELGIKAKDDKELMTQFRKESFKAVNDMARQMTGGGADKYSLNEVTRRLYQTMLGINTKGMRVENFEELKTTFTDSTTKAWAGVSKDMRATMEAERKAKEAGAKPPLTEEEKIKEAMEINVGAIDSAKMTIGSVVADVGNFIMKEMVTGVGKRERKEAGQEILERTRMGVYTGLPEQAKKIKELDLAAQLATKLLGVEKTITPQRFEKERTALIDKMTTEIKKWDTGKKEAMKTIIMPLLSTAKAGLSAEEVNGIIDRVNQNKATKGDIQKLTKAAEKLAERTSIYAKED